MSSRSQSPFDQLNNSVSKMKYTIPKAKRFAQPTKDFVDKYYDLPPIFGREGQKTGIGYGKKVEMGPKVDLPCPSPTKYDTSSLYDMKNKNGIKFGFGREELKLGGIFRPKKDQTPGPAAYTIPSLIKDQNITLKPRLNTLAPSNTNAPGPGAYQLPAYLSTDGKYSLSTIRNSLVPNFAAHKTLSKKKKTQLPGPGSYDMKENLFGKSLFNSKFHTSQSQTFCKVQRKIFPDIEHTIGPGSYNKYSEFDA